MVFEITAGDTEPALRAILRDVTKRAYHVQTDDTVTFRMRPAIPGLRSDIDAPVTVNDAASGDVSYEWDTADTEVPGVFDAEFHVSHASGGGEKTFPNGEFIRVVIKPAAISD